jgi:hypothetical protein
MKTTLLPFQKVARVIRLMGVLSFVMSVGISWAVLAPSLAAGEAVPPSALVLVALLVAVPLLQFVIARGLFAQRPWARVGAIIYSILALFGFPLGTIIGLYLLWQLQLDRHRHGEQMLRAAGDIRGSV